MFDLYFNFATFSRFVDSQWTRFTCGDMGEVLQCGGIFGHFSSAPLIMRAYGYQGSVMDVLARLATVETQDSFEPPMDRILVPGAILDR